MKRQLKPSLTWFFFAIATVLIAGFAWLEFHQHGQAGMPQAVAREWQPPKISRKKPISIKAPTEGARNTQKVAMPKARPKSKASPSADTSHSDIPTPSGAAGPASTRNYDDIPAEPIEEQAFVPAVERDPVDADQEIEQEREDAPEKILMKGFGGDPTKLSDELQEEFDELSQEHGDKDHADVGAKKTDQEVKASKVEPPLEDNGGEKSEDTHEHAEPAAEPSDSNSQPEE